MLAARHLVDMDGEMVDMRPVTHGNIGNGQPRPPLLPRAAQIAMADPMKVFVKRVYEFTDEQLWGPSQMRNAPDRRYPRAGAHVFQKEGSVFKFAPDDELPSSVCKGCGAEWKEGLDKGECTTYLSPREALQQLGSEWGRARWDSTWIAMALRWSDKLRSGVRSRKAGDSAHTFANSWVLDKVEAVVISDVRFVNEAKMIRDQGGEVWRLVRPEVDRVEGTHMSEREQTSSEMGHYVTFTLDNSGTLDELYGQVRSALG